MLRSEPTVLQQAADVAQIAAVLGLFLLWVQIRLQARTSKTELITGMTALITTVGNAFIEHPELRPYFYENRDPRPRHRERTRAIAVVLVSAMDHVAVHFKAMDRDTRAAWKQYFNDIYKTSPVVRDQLGAHANWYGSQLREHFGLDHKPVRRCRKAWGRFRRSARPADAGSRTS